MPSAIVPSAALAKVGIERGEGRWLTATTCERYVGLAVGSPRCSHYRLLKALAAQIGKLWRASNLFQVLECGRLARLLTDAVFADMIICANVGVSA